LRILVDTNVALDVILERSPFLPNSSRVLGTVERGEAEGYLCSTTVTTIFYVTRKQSGGPAARRGIAGLLSYFDVAAIDRAALRRALRLDFDDFEDAVIHEAALEAKADAIVTRNPAHFRASVLPVYTPEEFLKVINPSGPA
jgi:predicted nucleic acid-binding protein